MIRDDKRMCHLYQLIKRNEIAHCDSGPSLYLNSKAVQFIQTLLNPTVETTDINIIIVIGYSVSLIIKINWITI